jgi:Domain of unknown function DUF11
MPRLGIAIALVVLAAFGLSGAVAWAASPNQKCTSSGPLVCADIVGKPATVSPSKPDAPHFVTYSSTVANDGKQSATHVTADLELTGGLVLDSATPSVGSCSVNAEPTEPTCSLGRLAGGDTATIDFTARVPLEEAEACEASAEEKKALATLTATFGEGDGPDADPTQDSVSSTECTTIDEISGSAASFVPKGRSVSLTTDPTNTGVATAADPLIGEAVITTSPFPTTASILEVDAPFTCPRNVICRDGDWLEASIPGTFRPPLAPPLAFTLRWDSTLIPSSLSVKKFALIYTEGPGSKLEIISARCSSPTPDDASELPCLTGVAKLRDGDYVATLISDHNGRMR